MQRPGGDGPGESKTTVTKEQLGGNGKRFAYPPQVTFRRAREAHDFARYLARMTLRSMRAAGFRPSFGERERVRALFAEDVRAAARDRAEDELVAWFCDFVATFDAAQAMRLRACAMSVRLRVEVVDLAAVTDLAALGPLLS